MSMDTNVKRHDRMMEIYRKVQWDRRMPGVERRVNGGLQ